MEWFLIDGYHVYMNPKDFTTRSKGSEVVCYFDHGQKICYLTPDKISKSCQNCPNQT